MKPHHSTDLFAGMVRVNTGLGAYLTFRTLGEWQSGKWLVGSKPG
ncbi:MAG: hypothetical protein V5B39_11480 [Accumulibacter sp.]|jgi:hypothetical protein